MIKRIVLNTACFTSRYSESTGKDQGYRRFSQLFCWRF